jgi:hypothetical protein
MSVSALESGAPSSAQRGGKAWRFLRCATADLNTWPPIFQALTVITCEPTARLRLVSTFPRPPAVHSDES